MSSQHASQPISLLFGTPRQGKGLLQTYWVEVSSITASSVSSGSPRAVSLSGSVTEMSHNNDEKAMIGSAELSRQQHQEYKEIIDKIKQEVAV